MKKDPIPSQPSKTIDELDISDDMREALERIQGYYKATEPIGDKLQTLYNEGKTEEVREKIEDLAYDLMAQGDPEYQSLLEQRQQNPNADISSRVNEIAALYVAFIASEAGLPDEARFTEIEQARDNVQIILSNELGHAPDDPQEVQKVLGILQYDDKGKASYHFPAQFVPDSVNEKWNVYLATVCAHVKADAELKNKDTDDRAKVEEADRMRKYAHDSVTRDVHAILGLQDIKGWEFKDTRDLLGTIRNHVFPTLGSPRHSDLEERHASELLEHYSRRELRITQSLSHH